MAKANIPAESPYLTLLENARSIDDLSQWVGEGTITVECDYQATGADNVVHLFDDTTVQIIAPNLAANRGNVNKFLLTHDNKFLNANYGGDNNG